jgi:hypothetical protein
VTPSDLIKALRELEQRGWPVEVAPKTGISDSPHVAFVEPEAGHIGGLNITLHKPLPWDAEALVCGWLCKQLEAREYRREVFQHFTFGIVNVTAVQPLEDRYEKHSGGWHDTELEALIVACLAVAGADR